jgi:hypothetical protein
MLPQLETIFELLLWNSFQCRRHFFMSSLSWNLRPFKADFTSGNSHNSLGAKSGVQGACSILVNESCVTNSLIQSALWAGTLSSHEIQSLGQSSGLFLRTAARNRFSIWLAVWSCEMNPMRTIPMTWKKVRSIVFICYLDKRDFSDRGDVGCFHCKLRHFH